MSAVTRYTQKEIQDAFTAWTLSSDTTKAELDRRKDLWDLYVDHRDQRPLGCTKRARPESHTSREELEADEEVA